MKTGLSMKKTINGKTFNTDTSIEMGVTGRMVDVSNGVKTFVLERMYETRKGDEWFLVTTTFDDVFVSSEKSFQTLEYKDVMSWIDNLSTTYMVTKKF